MSPRRTFFFALVLLTAVLASVVTPGSVEATGLLNTCGGLPGWAHLRQHLATANAQINLILNNNMWATLVAPDGTVCAVAATGGDTLQAQWLLSRVISAQKANTANGLSLEAGQGPASTIPGLALSTANLWKAVQPGGSLYGLQHSNIINTDVAYRGSSLLFGTAVDPMVGGRIGGVNVFGGGLALYNRRGTRVGGVGVSGDTSCRDHMVAWELRRLLGLDFVPAGVSGDPLRPDNIIFDVNNRFGHPNCLDANAEKAAAAALSPVRPLP
jgi:hypothetical protein